MNVRIQLVLSFVPVISKDNVVSVLNQVPHHEDVSFV
jgi:hypothetical protein